MFVCLCLLTKGLHKKDREKKPTYNLERDWLPTVIIGKKYADSEFRIYTLNKLVEIKNTPRDFRT